MKYSKFKRKNSSNGYTLIELLAVTSIIVILTGLILGVLYSTLRGGSKTRVTSEVSQNGNFALSVMSQTALLAGSVTKVGGNAISDCTTLREGESIEFEQQDGAIVSFACDGGTSSIASTSGTTTTYLIDNNSVKVDHTTCSFTCFQPDSNPYALPIIGISFIVSQRSSSTLFENLAQGVYKTSVTMRNYDPK